MSMRLQKYIAHAGVCSRRHAEKLILEGKVKVNNTTVTKLGTSVDPNKDLVLVQNKKIAIPVEDFVYIALNKPLGYVCSANGKQGKTVLDLLTKKNQVEPDNKPLKTRVYPIGRLDKDSEGLVILTNDGELTNKLTHPRNRHEKEYLLTIDKPITPDIKKELSKGMVIDNEKLQGIKMVSQKKIGKRYEIRVILYEGKNRQLKKMFGRLGYNLNNLRRTRIAKYKLNTVSSGQWKFISKNEII